MCTLQTTCMVFNKVHSYLTPLSFILYASLVFSLIVKHVCFLVKTMVEYCSYSLMKPDTRTVSANHPGQSILIAQVGLGLPSWFLLRQLQLNTDKKERKKERKKENE